MNGLLGTLDFSKGGIPETGSVNKNRQALLVVDLKKDSVAAVMMDITRLVQDLYDGKVDTITIDVKERAW